MDEDQRIIGPYEKMWHECFDDSYYKTTPNKDLMVLSMLMELAKEVDRLNRVKRPDLVF